MSSGATEETACALALSVNEGPSAEEALSEGAGLHAVRARMVRTPLWARARGTRGVYSFAMSIVCLFVARPPWLPQQPRKH
jgi:hypothetical protein